MEQKLQIKFLLCLGSNKMETQPTQVIK